jgi:hypothetical protein
VSFWNLWEKDGTRYDSHGTNNLVDNNTVEGATGPIEVPAGENAAISKWVNQGGNASPFGDPSLNSLWPTLLGGLPTWDGTVNGLRTLTGNATQPNTLFCIATLAELTGYRNITSGGLSGGRQDLYLNINDTVAVYAGASARSILNPEDTARHSYAVIFDGAANRAATDTSTLTTIPVSVGVNNLAGFTIGALFNVSGNRFFGTIECALVFDRALTEDEIAALITHFI